MKNFLGLLTVAFACPLLAPEMAQAAQVYTGTLGGEIGVFDDQTGVYQSIMRSPVFFDVALDNNGGLWGATTRSLYKIDPIQKTTTLVGSGNLGNALGFATNNRLYGAGGNRFFEVNTTTGASTLISQISGFVSSGDIVFDATRNLFWATSAANPSSDSLWQIALDGTARLVGNTGFSALYGLAFSDNGSLFGYTVDARQVALNLDTGLGTVVRRLSGDMIPGGIGGTASNPRSGSQPPDRPVSTPEPSLLLGGLAIAGWLGRSRRRQIHPTES